MMSRYLVLLGWMAVMTVLAASPAGAQPVNITREVTIPQQDVRAGKIPLRKIIESGAHFFSAPYVLPDGWGEGPDGPRAWQRKAFYPNSPFLPNADPPVPPIPLLRVDGIDSQSCYECHQSIGVSVLPDLTATGEYTRTQPAIGGTAGIANLAFINPQFPNPLTQLLRKPPQVFGTGYTQAIANEMTAELYSRKQALEAQARSHPKQPQEAVLTAKGLPFGTLKITYDPAAPAGSQFEIDTSAVNAVAEDLVVRPFQWKGISSSIRHFVAAATQFHFSMEAVEVVGENIDNDGDGIVNELDYGNVGALTTFVTLTRPPVVETVTDPERRRQAARGQAIFEGTATDAGIPPNNRMCASCHLPTLRLNTPVVTVEWGTRLHTSEIGSDQGIELPSRVGKSLAAAAAPAPGKRVIPNLVTPFDRTEDLPVIRGLRAAPAAEAAALASGAAASPNPEGLEINLNTLQWRVTASGPWHDLDGKPDAVSPPDRLPAYTRNRLPFQNPNGPLDIPVHSDLRLHAMGPCLTDITFQGTDVLGVDIPAQKFLTRPLWGIADSFPYLHDARARDLIHAIYFHGGTRPAALAEVFPYVCAGSEADPVIDAFYKLSESDQNNLLVYLSTLRLPTLPGSVVPF